MPETLNPPRLASGSAGSSLLAATSTGWLHGGEDALGDVDQPPVVAGMAALCALRAWMHPTRCPDKSVAWKAMAEASDPVLRRL